MGRLDVCIEMWAGVRCMQCVQVSYEVKNVASMYVCWRMVFTHFTLRVLTYPNGHGKPRSWYVNAIMFKKLKCNIYI